MFIEHIQQVPSLRMSEVKNTKTYRSGGGLLKTQRLTDLEEGFLSAEAEAVEGARQTV